MQSKYELEFYAIGEMEYIVIDRELVLEIHPECGCTETWIKEENMCFQRFIKTVYKEDKILNNNDMENLIKKGELNTGFSTENIMNILGYGIPNALKEKGHKCHATNQTLHTEAKKEEIHKQESGL